MTKTYSTLALVGTLIAGFAGSAVAQTANSANNAASESDRCSALYAQWSKYNGTSSYSKNVAPEMALEECHKGNTQAGIADLRSILERNRIPLPATETANNK